MQNDLKREPIHATGYVKKVLDAIEPIASMFAKIHNGKSQTIGNEITIRALSKGTYVTIQICVKGKTDDLSIEITGIKRSGLESGRVVISLNKCEVDAAEVKKGLDSVLAG